MSTPIRVTTTKQVGTWPKGTELGFATTAQADKALGAGTYRVLSHQDGTEWTPPKRAASPPPDEKKGE